jgi:hypothetical protein
MLAPLGSCTVCDCDCELEGGLYQALRPHVHSSLLL